MVVAMENLAGLVKEEKLDLLEAQKWANDLTSFADAMKRI